MFKSDSGLFSDVQIFKSTPGNVPSGECSVIRNQGNCLKIKEGVCSRRRGAESISKIAMKNSVFAASQGAYGPELKNSAIFTSESDCCSPR